MGCEPIKVNKDKPKSKRQDLELLDALLYLLDVRAEVQPPLLLQLLLRRSEPSPDVVQVRVQLLPLLLVLLGADLFAEVLSLQELPALNHACGSDDGR